ncbi:MAG: acylphosphatase [Nitrososphaeria archaeon]
MKKKIVLEGEKVNGILYKTFLLEKAESCNLKGLYVKDGEKNVEAFIDGEVLDINKFLSEVGEAGKNGASARIAKVEDYYGNVMKLESFYRILVLRYLEEIYGVVRGVKH